MKNVFGLILALVCLFLLSNVSNAQDCKNGKCPTGKIVPQGFSQGQLSSKTVSSGCSGGCSSATSSFKSTTTFSTGQHKGLFQRIKERRHGG